MCASLGIASTRLEPDSPNQDSMIIYGFVGAVQRMLTPLCRHYPRGISTTSYDPDHTGAHALTPDLRQFWHTTGFFPQVACNA